MKADAQERLSAVEQDLEAVISFFSFFFLFSFSYFEFSLHFLLFLGAFYFPPVLLLIGFHCRWS